MNHDVTMAVHAKIDERVRDEVADRVEHVSIALTVRHDQKVF
jgi:low affinity Fe/Cu permease